MSFPMALAATLALLFAVAPAASALEEARPGGENANATPADAPVLEEPGRSGEAELEKAKRALLEGENAEGDEARTALYEQAAEHAEKAVALIPDDANAHFVLFAARGRVAQMGGLASAALALPSLNAQLDEVLRLDPDHADALASRGGILVKLPRLLGGNTGEGIRYLERANELSPNGAGKRIELAEAYEIVDRLEDALRTAREAVAIAERKKEDEKLARARELLARLEDACKGCALAAPAHGTTMPQPSGQ